MASRSDSATASDPAGSAVAEFATKETTTAGGTEVSRIAGEVPAPDRAQAPNGGETTPRIIYTAEVEMVVDDFTVARDKLTELIEESGGYIASSSMDRNAGQLRTGRWVARVPVGAFEGFLASLDRLGFVESRDISSQDVTMEYIDVASRIESLKRLEERLVALLENETGKLEDVLKVEQELARVRGEIESAQGRMRYLTNRTEFTTATVAIRQERHFVPSQTLTLTGQISDAWFNSLETLSSAGVVLIVGLVAVTPWLVILALVLAVLYGLARLVFVRKTRRES